MAARAKNRKKNSDDIFSVTTGWILTKLNRIVSSAVLYQNYSNCFALLHKMATRAKNKINKRHLLCNHWVDFNQLIRLFLGRSSIKSAQIILLHCTKWLPELKIDKTSNNISVTTGPISTKLDWIVLWEVLYQNCSNWSSPLHKMAFRVKNRKKLQTTSPPLPLSGFQPNLIE